MSKKAPVQIIMGSQSDWPALQLACKPLEDLQVPYHASIVSAHRTPDRLDDFCKKAEDNGTKVIIAGAGGAAHLPGMVASLTVLPVLGVPVQATELLGLDALLSIVQMPKGVPVGTLAIDASGAINAALLATRILGTHHPELRERLRAWSAARRDAVMADREIR